LVNNKEKQSTFRKKLVANARAIISNQIGLPLGCLKMGARVEWLQEYEAINYPVFAAYNKESSSVPVGSERLDCSRDELRRHDAVLDELNSRYKEQVIDACFEIISRFDQGKK
jgi:hypothetical protein